MRRQFLADCAATLGAVVLSVTSLVVYQQVTVAQGVLLLAMVEPVAPPAALPAALEPMELEEAKPAGRFLPMRKTGRE